MIALREGVATAARIAAFVPLRGDDSVPPCAVNSRLWHPGAKSSRFPSRSQRAAETKDPSGDDGSNDEIVTYRVGGLLPVIVWDAETPARRRDNIPRGSPHPTPSPHPRPTPP